MLAGPSKLFRLGNHGSPWILPPLLLDQDTHWATALRIGTNSVYAFETWMAMQRAVMGKRGRETADIIGLSNVQCL